MGVRRARLRTPCLCAPLLPIVQRRQGEEHLCEGKEAEVPTECIPEEIGNQKRECGDSDSKAVAQLSHQIQLERILGASFSSIPVQAANMAASLIKTRHPAPR